MSRYAGRRFFNIVYLVLSFAATLFGLMFLFLVLTACVTPVAVRCQPSQGPAAPEEIVIRLSSFSYSPDTLRLRVGVPVRLRLVSESSGRHNFVARAFFAASDFVPGFAPPADGAVEVAAGKTVELTLIPRMPGTYPVRCTHFLHSLFGMRGTIVVMGPSG